MEKAFSFIPRRLAIRLRAKQPDPVDPRPHELAENRRPPSIKEELQRYIRTQVSQAAEREGFGTFEEEDDFDDDTDPNDREFFSKHEVRWMRPDSPETLDGAETPPQPPPAPGPGTSDGPVAGRSPPT